MNIRITDIDGNIADNGFQGRNVVDSTNKLRKNNWKIILPAGKIFATTDQIVRVPDLYELFFLLMLPRSAKLVDLLMNNRVYGSDMINALKS